MAYRIDLTGRRSGLLTVIEYAGDGKWLCKCDCGNTVKVRTGNINSGTTKSCGCVAHHTGKEHHNWIDRTGIKYGMLTAIKYVGNSKWLCKCDCGNETIVLGKQLTSGMTKSCGCLKRKKSRDRHLTHGFSRSERLYTVWGGMKQRCSNPLHSAYKDYGGRGIKVCDEWLNDYVAFRTWALDNGYDPNAKHGECTIDRIDVNGDYCPENCRFVDSQVQAQNRRKFEQPSRRKPVEQIDEHGNVIARYESVKQATLETGLPRGGISNVCRGVCHSTMGTYWRFAQV